MDAFTARLRRERAVQALVPLFLLSGATGLVYQTLWSRQLQLVFGTTTFAIATVLAAFMAGLALGGAVMARLADRLERPLAVYGALEIAIGGYALAFPWLLDAVSPVYLWAWRAWDPGPVAFGGIQLALVGSLLVIPTAWMGATLPLLARFAVDRMGAAGRRVGLLYAVNTAGAVLGTWLAGFVLLPGLGLWTTTCAAAAANVLLGLGALALSSWAAHEAPDDGPSWEELAASTVEDVPESPDEPPEEPVEPAVVAAAVSAGLAGYASLVYEVAWFRLLALILGASVYAFSVMLLAFLVGIAVGGAVGGRWGDRAIARGGVAAVLRALAGVQVGVAVTALASTYAFGELPFAYVALFDALAAADRPGAVWWVQLLLSGAVMTPPALLMGAAFPLAVRAAVGRADGVGEAVGRVYAANTLGGVFGAATAGFLLLPTLQVVGTLGLAGAVNLVAAGVAAVAASRRAAPRGATWLGAGAAAAVVGVAVVLPPTWDPLLMTAGMYKYVSSLDEHGRDDILDYAVRPYELLYYREGLSSVVTVARNRDTQNIWLANNGKVDASTTIDMPTQILVSLLPLQHVEDPADVLVIGLASGITAGALTLVDEVERLDVVELEPAIREASDFFVDFNHGLLEDPRTRLLVADGRNHVLRTPPGTYDVVVSEPSNPWLTGVSNLFTREFFELGRSRLAPGGVWAQWVQMYGMDDADLRSLLGTFADVFPHVLVYAAAEDADLVLLGADHPLPPSEDAAARLFRWPAVADALEEIDMAGPADVQAALVLTRDDVLRLAGGVERNTDDNLRIEYRAPLHLHEDTQELNVPLLYRHARVPRVDGDHDPAFLAALAEAYRTRDDPDRALDALVEAALTAPADSPERADRLARAFDWYVEERAPEDAPVTPSVRRLLEAEFVQKRVRRVLEEAQERSEGPSPE